jgi:hypothetical protein
LDEEAKVMISIISEKIPDFIEDTLFNSCLFAVTWSIGAALDEKSRKQFSEFIISVVDETHSTELLFLPLKYENCLPKFRGKSNLRGKNLFDLYYDISTCKWL